MNGGLPSSWERVQLGQICLPRAGKVIPASDDVRPYLSLDNIASDSGAVIGWEKSSDYGSQSVELYPEDVAYARLRPYLNKVAHVDCVALGSAELIVLPKSQSILPRYLQYSLLSPSFCAFAQHESTGDRPRLKWRQMQEYEIPLPPIDEQARIVAAIEEHFSRLDAVHSALEAAQLKLDAMLLSVLRETCSGSWPETALSELIVSLKNGVFVSRPSLGPPGKPIYRISAVRPLNLRVSDVRYAHPVPDKADSYAVDAGDLLFTRYSGNPQYVGAAAVVTPEGAGVLHPDKLIRVVADQEKVLPEWIAAYVAAGKGRSEIEKRLKTTAGQVGISGSQLKTVPIAVPPLSYQEMAAARIGLILDEQERIRQQLSELALKEQALRRSILADAFSGRLVPQDPNDEPASALLDRIANADHRDRVAAAAESITQRHAVALQRLGE